MRIRQTADDDIATCLPDGVEAPTAGPPAYLEDVQWRWLMELGCESQGRKRQCRR